MNPLRLSGQNLVLNAENADFQVWSEDELSAYPVSSGYLLP